MSSAISFRAEEPEDLAFERLEVLAVILCGKRIVRAGHRAGDAAIPAAAALLWRDDPALGGTIALFFLFRLAHGGRLRSVRGRVDAKSPLFRLTDMRA